MRGRAARWLVGGALLSLGLCGCSGRTASPAGGYSSSSGGSGGANASSSSGSSGSGSSGGSESSGGSSDGSSGSSTSSGGEDDGGSSESSSGGQTGDGGLKTYPPLKFSDIGQPVMISNQFYFSEGPVWDPVKNVLYFTDINAQQSGRTVGAIYRLTPPSTTPEVFLQPAGSTDGLGLDPGGTLIGAGFVSRSIWRLSGNTMQTLAACSSPASATCYTGKEVNTPDDITARSDGVIYFTDPTFGSGSQGFPAQNLPLSGAQGVYRLTKDGALHLEDTSSQGPNGVNLSPDETTLYVAYTLGNSVASFSVAADGSLSNKKTFASAALADSMCVDDGGNVYVATSGGIAVFNPAGQSQGTIAVGGQLTTNCAFGGADQRTLYITSRAQSTLVGTPVANDSSLFKIDNMPVPGTPYRN